jgi:hypothetical protein
MHLSIYSNVADPDPYNFVRSEFFVKTGPDLNYYGNVGYSKVHLQIRGTPTPLRYGKPTRYSRTLRYTVSKLEGTLTYT